MIGFITVLLLVVAGAIASGHISLVLTGAVVVTAVYAIRRMLP